MTSKKEPLTLIVVRGSFHLYHLIWGVELCVVLWIITILFVWFCNRFNQQRGCNTNH